MPNLQPIEKYVDSSLLDVFDIFYTIQGEGPFTGTPCVFVRLAGCNLQCPMCDTDYTSKRTKMSTQEILFRCIELFPATIEKARLVVITGGEPFRQNIFHLMQSLDMNNFFVQVETNGTLKPPAYRYESNTSKREGIYLVCSPKAGVVNLSYYHWACCFKYVLSHNSMDPTDGLPIQVLDHTVKTRVGRPSMRESNRLVYLQPADSGDPNTNALNVAAVRDSCLKHGYIFQLQTHKLIGVD
jgi:organic radical activating enzyme